MKHMKKALLGALLLLLAVALCACGTQENAETQAQAGAGRMVNLTALSQSMRYAQAYNMLHIAPEEYIGSTVRVKGPHSAIFNEATRKNDHYITVSDSTVCCWRSNSASLCAYVSFPWPHHCMNCFISFISSPDRLRHSITCSASSSRSLNLRMPEVRSRLGNSPSLS